MVRVGFGIRSAHEGKKLMAFEIGRMRTAVQKKLVENRDLAKLLLPKCRSRPEVSVGSPKTPKYPFPDQQIVIFIVKVKKNNLLERRLGKTVMSRLGRERLVRWGAF